MSKYRRPDAKTIQELKDMANKLRIDSIRSTNAGKSGHPTSCCSAAEIVSVLFFHSMHYKKQEPRHPSNDRFVLSKGHAAPLLYSVWAEVGLFPTNDLLKLRSIDSDLEGHPTPRLNFIDVATGSLGQGLSCAAGMAYTGKYLDKASYRVYCMIGDGESAEGSIWEALAFSSHYKLDNLVAIFDINRLGQSEPTALQHDLDTYKRRVEAFGCNTYVIDGHNVEELCKVFHDASTVKGMPTCILAKTFKGKGIIGIEDCENWHGKILGDKADKAINEITALIHNQGKTNLSPRAPNDDAPPVNISNIRLSEPPNYKIGEKVATRFAYGTAISKLGFNNPHVIALDGDTKNSTFSEKFKKDHPERFIEGFIAEQNIVGVAVGCGTRGRTVPFVSLFAAFFTRAFDQLRMAAISQANIKCAGSHVGVSIGEDGPSQMALEDLAMFRSIPSSIVFYPSDAVACERSCELAANVAGICYIRTSRPNTPVIYSNDEKFEIGKAKIVLQSDSDQVTVIAAGITLHEAVRAAEELASAGINICIIDLFTVKPLDIKTILSCVKRTEGRVVTVEDHYPEGGIGESVATALSSERNVFLKMLAVRSLPRSGPPEVLIDRFGIGSKTIIKTVQSILNC